MLFNFFLEQTRERNSLCLNQILKAMKTLFIKANTTWGIGLILINYLAENLKKN
jgi:hypothetical protein